MCELKSRLFDAEIEFPPFDFLKQSGGRDNLYDYNLMNQCLLLSPSDLSVIAAARG